MSGKNKEALQGIYDNLGTFLAAFDEPEETGKSDDESGEVNKNEVKKEEIDMTKDLDLNGDTKTDSTDDDYDFLKINDGCVKQLAAGSNIVDRSTIDDGAMSIDVFYSAIKALPNKYNNGKLKWIMSPHRYQDWIYTLLNSAVTNGGIITDGRIEDPCSIGVVQCANLSDDKIILTDPKKLIEVGTYNMMIRKTTEGMHAIMEDKRFYVVHLDYDPIIEELDAACLITGFAEI